MGTTNPFRVAIRNLTLTGALIAYVALAVYISWKTWDAAAGTVPPVPGVQAGVLGALAVALGGGYAAVLGVSPRVETREEGAGKPPLIQRLWEWLSSLKTQSWLLGIGVVCYMGIGGAVGTTYLLNEAETPGVLKTIAVGFGGYVIAYIAAAYQDAASG